LRGGSTSPTTGSRDFPEVRGSPPKDRGFAVTAPRRPAMSASLIRSRTMVTHVIDRHRWNEITDGAVLQEDATIVEIGIYQELSRKHPKCTGHWRRRSSSRLRG
jgi:hypothetical protein